MPITPLFAAVFALFYLLLSISVVRMRMGQGVSLGSTDNKPLQKAVRIHANFIEYVPLALILFWFMEMISLDSGLVFWLGSALLASRFAHVIGMNNPRSFMVFRQIGVIGTFGVILVASLSLLWWYLPVSI